LGDGKAWTSRHSFDFSFGILAGVETFFFVDFTRDSFFERCGEKTVATVVEARRMATEVEEEKRGGNLRAPGPANMAATVEANFFLKTD
jgi:hypothetical protein